MQLGQQICTTGSPHCNICPISDNCQGFQEGIAQDIPEKTKKLIKTTKKTALIFCSDGKILIRKKKRKIFHDLWLLPTVEDNSTERMAWMKKVWSQLTSRELTIRNHFYTDHKDIITPCLILSPFLDLTYATPADDEDFTYQWVAIEDLDQYPAPSVYRKILNEAKEHL